MSNTHITALYRMNLACVSNPFVTNLTSIDWERKRKLEEAWEQSEREKHAEILQSLPAISDFSAWVKKKFSCDLHPIFHFLKEHATLSQLREFMFQESGLEMLFGDIMAFMLPGIYGGVKMEVLKNYWDECGRGQEALIHRNLRITLMRKLQISEDCYLKNTESILSEELAKTNLYLSLATNRDKLPQLVGVLLATEITIPGSFEYLIAGFKRLGFSDEVLVYLHEHISVDAVHAEDWLRGVVIPLLEVNPALLSDIVLGVCRRITISTVVLDRLYEHLRVNDARL